MKQKLPKDGAETEPSIGELLVPNGGVKSFP